MSPAPGRFPGNTPRVNVVIIHDDFANGRWGLLFLEGFTALCGDAVGFVPRVFKIEDLLSSRCGKLLDGMPDETRIVIIAVYEETVLPPRIAAWVQNCTKKGQDSGGVLVVLGTTPREFNASVKALSSVLCVVGRQLRPESFAGRAVGQQNLVQAISPGTRGGLAGKAYAGRRAMALQA